MDLLLIVVAVLVIAAVSFVAGLRIGWVIGYDDGRSTSIPWPGQRGRE